MAVSVAPSETTTTTKYRAPAKASGFNLTSTEALLGAAAAGAYLLFGLRSSSSATVTTTTPTTTVPTTTTAVSAPPLATPNAPSLLEEIGRTAGSVVVECTPVSGATLYTWYDESTNLPLATSPTNVARISNLQANTTYMVYVVASNSAGNGPPSQPLMVGTNLTNVPETTAPSVSLPTVTTTVIIDLLRGTAPQGTGGQQKPPPTKTLPQKPTLTLKTQQVVGFDPATCTVLLETIGHYSDGTTRKMGTTTQKEPGCTPQKSKAPASKVTLKYAYNHYLYFDAATCLDHFEKIGVYSDGSTKDLGPVTQTKPGCTPQTPTHVAVGSSTVSVQTGGGGVTQINLGHSHITTSATTTTTTTATTAKPPTEAPFNLTHSAVLGASGGQVHVVLGWSPVGGATHYQVTLASGRPLTTVPANSVQNGQVVANVYVTPNTPYYLAVQACNAAGCGPKAQFNNGQPITFNYVVPGPTLVNTTTQVIAQNRATCQTQYQESGTYSDGTTKVLRTYLAPTPNCTPTNAESSGPPYGPVPGNVSSAATTVTATQPAASTSTAATSPTLSTTGSGQVIHISPTGTVSVASSTVTRPPAKTTAPTLVYKYQHYVSFDAATCLYTFQTVGVYTNGQHKVLSTYTQVKSGCHPATGTGSVRVTAS